MMLARAVTVPKLIAGVSAFAVILLLAALASRTETRPSFDFFKKPNAGVSQHLLARLNLAEKIWGQAVKDREKMVEHVGLDRDFPDGYNNPYNVWDFARPSFFCPHDLERVGKLGDGGKVVCGMSRYEKEAPGPSSAENPAREMVIYSLGVNRDSSFEEAMMERTNVQIWGYDFSVDSWASEVAKGPFTSRAHFTKAGIGKETDPKRDPPFYTVQDLMKANGHEYVDIIKMDIEGAEFDALTSFVEHTIKEAGDKQPVLPFGQLLLEVHFWTDKEQLHIPRKLETWMKWWSSLEELGLRPVNNEDNWIGDVAFGKARFMEYTLINVLNAEDNILLWG
ncbi:uncharacterized protein DNG_09516 [Cephalotrichum gorgonifer]|uniref:Methyltransferase domain-containing protein n=1 Tax=Cephalotrichum gorgonifer TaxID=2041049 RepID=A0AAE8N8B8_9PEZI|nr:uncharacterized protein DNG_09516 [Cephalotrichum gorgonifer]